MNVIIKDINISYMMFGSGRDILLLHGWGQNKEMMLPLGKKLEGFRITILDLPGFGASSEPTKSYDIYEYTEVIHDFDEEVGLKKPIVIGHSFGGRIGIIYASKYEVDKLILFGAPCVRERKTSVKEKLLKNLKKIPGTKLLVEVAKNYIGSTDYKNASVIMRGILVNTINEDLSECAQKITAPTILIWGTNDTAAPISDAMKLEKLLKDGALIKIEGATHYAYLEHLDYVVKIIKSFIGGN